MIINGRFAKRKRPVGDNMFDIGFFNWHICRQEIERLIKELQQKQEYIAEKECQIFTLAKTIKESKLIADSEANSMKEFMNYQLKQKDGIIERLNETIEGEENENILLQNKIAEANKILEKFAIDIHEIGEFDDMELTDNTIELLQKILAIGGETKK